MSFLVELDLQSQEMKRQVLALLVFLFQSRSQHSEVLRPVTRALMAPYCLYAAERELDLQRHRWQRWAVYSYG